jgi:hypothetical protein
VRSGLHGHRVAVALVLVVAGTLRCWGLAFGLPHTFARPDEDAVQGIALQFFQRDFNPRFFDWPTLYMYLVGALHVVYFNIGRLLGWFPLEYDFLVRASQNPAPLFLIARALTAFSGVVTVWLLYLTGRRLAGTPTALVAALFLAVAPLHVRDSHFGVTDVAATSLVAAALLFVVRYRDTLARRDLLFAALFTGLAASTKYNAALIAVPALLAVVMGEERQQRRVRLAAEFCVVAVAAFLIGTPYAAIDWPAWVRGLRNITEHLSAGHAVREGPAWRIHLASSLWYGLGWPMLITGVMGLIVYAWRDRRAGLLFTIFPVLYFALIGSGQTAFARYIIPVVPFLCFAAAYFVTQSARVMSSTVRGLTVATLTAALAVIVAGPAAWASLQTDRLLARTDNRVLAATWLLREYPAGATMHQSGAVYGQLQFHQSTDRYPQLAFDGPARVFRTTAGADTSPPQLVVVQEHPLTYSDVSPALRDVLAEDYRLVTTFEALRGADAGLAFDRDDAFYVPLAGFGAVTRPGPNLFVYQRR